MSIKKTLRKLASAVLSAAIVAGMAAAAVSASAAQITPSGYITIHHDFASQNAGAIQALAQGIRNRQSQINISQYHIPTSDARLLFEAVTNMNPELFYVDQGFSYYVTTYNGVSCIYSLVVDYTYTAAEVSTMMAEFDEKSDYYLSKIKPGMTDFEKALILHDELILNSSYLLDGSTYSLMVDGTGKCEDYSKAYAFLLAQAGIKCEMVISPKEDQNDTDGMSHQWVKVCIDGTYYHVDPTWDDPTLTDAYYYQYYSGETRPNTHSGLVYHTFFLVSDSLIGSTALGDPHTGYTSFYPSPSTYDNALLRDVKSRFCYVDGSLYAMKYNSSNYTGSLVRYNPVNNTTQTIKSFNYYWSAPGGGFWTGFFSGLEYLDGLFYFNSPNSVNTYDMTTDTVSEFAHNPSNGNIYGINIINRDVYAYTASNPNDFLDSWLLGHVDEPLPPLELGDVDGNGRVDIRDVTAIQRYKAVLIQLDSRQLAAADIDGDGNVTVNDATELQKQLAKIYTVN